jgi:hypothetical protein
VCDGKLLCVPYDAHELLVYDPSTDKTGSVRHTSSLLPEAFVFFVFLYFIHIPGAIFEHQQCHLLLVIV